MSLKEIIKSVPVLGPAAQKLLGMFSPSSNPPDPPPIPFRDSPSYWQDRYAAGGNSGAGSYSMFADFKAEIVNGFVREEAIQSVIEFGCGDGNQLSLAEYPRYLGFDISPAAVAVCQRRFAGDNSKIFAPVSAYKGETAELGLSLDVIYHLPEDDIFDRYMRMLFNAATRFVVIYSSDTNDSLGVRPGYIRHREFSIWVVQNVPSWKLRKHIPNRYPYEGDYERGSWADFYIFGRTSE